MSTRFTPARIRFTFDRYQKIAAAGLLTSSDRDVILLIEVALHDAISSCLTA
jgi:hypothetical protein